jgi:trigger factor
MPQASRQDLDNTSAVVTITVSKEELQSAVERELKKFKNRATIKGFRQGQAPMPFIKRMYGKNILNDVMNELFSNELSEYLQSSGLDILGQPLPSADQTLHTLKLDALEPEYSVRYDIGFVPKFDIQGLDKNETYEVLTISNLDELGEKDLEYLRKKAASQEETEDQIGVGDLLRVQARELDGDTVKADGLETSILFGVDHVTNEALKSHILTLRKGDTLRFNARELEKFGHEDDARYRKYILALPDDDEREVGDWFEGEIVSVMRMVLPELDEAFFKAQFGEAITDKEGALLIIKATISSFYEPRAFALLARDMQKRLLEQNEIAFPEAFLQRWLTEINQDKLSAEQVESELPAFIQSLRWNMIRDKLTAQFEIEATKAEIMEVYANRIRGYFQGQVEEDLVQNLAIRFMEEDEKKDEVIKEVEADKLYAAMRNLVTLVDKPVHSEVFHQLIEEAR